MRSHVCLVVVLSPILLLAACGLPGAPQPPSLHLPRPVNDLAAWRKGDHVYLSWTPPQHTTDGETVRHRGPTSICRSIAISRMEDCSQIAQLPPPNAPVESSEYSDTLAPEFQRQHPLGFAAYAVRVLNDRGKAAGLSNQVEVPLAPTLPPPTDLRAEVTAQGVALTWSGMLHEHEASELRHVYRVYRQTGTNPQTEVQVGQVQLSTASQASLLDSSFQWGQTYRYTVTTVTLVPAAPNSSATQVSGKAIEIEGDDSPPVTVTPEDVFPPAVPAAVEAVFSGPGQQPFIDLIWNPSPDTDLAGYNVYRSTAGQPAVRMNPGLIPTPAFRDSGIQAGTTYQYFITAVDVRGNESARSQPASETVP
jgi:hypothetical protein